MDPDDNTAIIDMKKTFQRFISSDDNRKRSRLDISDTSLLDASQASSVNQSYNRDADALSVKTNLMYCKSRIGMLESQLTNTETELKEQTILHEREISELKRLHDRELRGYSILKTSHDRVLHRQELCESELIDERATLAHVRQVYDEKIRRLQKRDMEMEILNTQQLDEQKAKCRELRNKLLSQQADLSVANSELAQVKELYAELKKKLNDSLSSSSESEEWKTRAVEAEERVKRLESELERYQDDMLVMSARKQDLAKLSKITEENKKLNKQVQYYKATIENVEIMKEEVQTMKRKTNNYESLQDKVAQLQVENESFVAKLTELQQRQIPEDTVVRLREAQEKEAVMLENVGELKSRNRQLESKVEELENSRSSLKCKLSGAGDEGDNKTKQIERLQRKVFLLTKERDGYKKILESYDCDVTREVVSHSTDKATQLQITVNSYMKVNDQLEKDIQSREQENLMLKQTVTQLEERLSNQTQHDALNDSTTADKVDQSQLLELRQKIEQLERHCEIITEEKEILEARIEQRNMQGDYDPTKTKVVHLRMNPVSVAQNSRAEEVRLLREDNMKLRERIKVLESNLADAHNITAQVEANLINPSAQESKELAEVKKRLSEAEMKGKRMLEVFSNTSKEFRQVVYRMTGYRIDIPQNHQYKLMNMYCNSPEDFLLFNETSDGDLQLLETDYASTLTELAEEHLYSQNSIPVFLSSLTLDLYKQQTMM